MPTELPGPQEGEVTGSNILCSDSIIKRLDGWI
jgi:hypothetical protein